MEALLKMLAWHLMTRDRGTVGGDGTDPDGRNLVLSVRQQTEGSICL